MKLSRLKKYLHLSFKKAKKPALILVVVIFISGFFKALGRDGVDLSPDNLIRITWVFLGSYVVLYVFVFWTVMWEYYINDDFVKDEDIK